MYIIREILSRISDVVDLVVYVLMALLFVFGIIRCIIPVLHNRGTLRRAVKKIKSGDRKQSWQEDAFLGKGSLFAHWSEYLNNLFFADGVYHNASNVEDYINEETVIYGPGSSGFSEALPGLMVSLGFMGTLIGLAVGLSGFDMGDETAIMTSIETLIPGLRYAFMTSIVGVIGSIAFTLISRIVIGSASRAIEDFYSAMSRHAGVLSVDPMTQVAIYQQEQTALIQTMAKDLNGEFTQRITSAISDAMNPLNDSLNRFVTVNTQEQMRFLDTVVTRFVSHMDQALGGQFDELSDVITRTVRNQEKLLTAVDGHVSGIARSAVDLKQLEHSAASLLEKLDAYMGRMSAAQKQADETYAKMSSNVETLQMVSRQQSDYLRQVAGMQNAVSDAADSLSEGVAGMTAAAAALEDTCGRIRAMRAELDREAAEATRRLAEAHNAALGEADAEMRRMLDALSGYLQDYTARMNESLRGITASVNNIPASMQGVSDAMAEQIERMNATLNRAQRAMDDVVDKMYGR